MKIDAHQHFWNYDAHRHGWISDDMASIRRDFLPGDLQPLLKKNHFDGSVVVQVDQTSQETENLLRLADQHQLIKGVVGWVDLRADDLEERLQQYSQFSQLKGFRHIAQAEPQGFLTQSKFINGVKMLRRYNFTYDLLIYHFQLDEAVTFLHSVPDTRIVLDHIAKPSIKTGGKTPWASGIAALSGFENVYCKVSGMVTEADWKNWEYEHFRPYMDKVFESFGPSRIMYGSDWPVCLVAASYDEQLGILERYISRMTAAEKQSVLGDNAKRFYNL
jgi:L-fuconolactonase